MNPDSTTSLSVATQLSKENTTIHGLATGNGAAHIDLGYHSLYRPPVKKENPTLTTQHWLLETKEFKEKTIHEFKQQELLQDTTVKWSAKGVKRSDSSRKDIGNVQQ